MRLADFGKLTEGEQAVIDGLGTGHVTVLGDGTLTARTPEMIAVCAPA